MKKEIEVKRQGYLPVVCNIEIVGKTLKVSTQSTIRFIDLCRYLLTNTSVLQIDYNRKCPYKLRIEKIHDYKKFSHKAYHIDFLEIKNDSLEEKTSHIIDLLGCNMDVNGEFECFIPDLMLVMAERGYVSFSNENNNYTLIRKFNMTLVEFKEVQKLLPPEQLKLRGFTVPSAYKRSYARLAR